MMKNSLLKFGKNLIDLWVFYAFISMFFAGFTSVIAKQGLTGISAELGLSLRTIFVFFFIILFAISTITQSEISLLRKENFFWLGLSGATTVLSWVFYYKALKLGDVATVALIDKGSVIVAILLAALMLQETITLRIIIGACLMMAGLLVITTK